MLPKFDMAFKLANIALIQMKELNVTAKKAQNLGPAAHLVGWICLSIPVIPA